MRISSTGLVGIGNTSPPTGVRVTSKAPSASGYNYFLEQNNGLDGYLLACTSNDGDLVFSRRDTSGTVTTERMRLSSAGFLLVGTTVNTNSYRLVVTDDIAIRTATDASGSTNLRLGVSSSMPQGIALLNGTKTAVGGGDMIFNTATGGVLAEKMRLLGDGNLGVGTTSPATKIDARGVVSAMSTGVDGTFQPAFNATYSGDTAFYGTIAHAMSSLATSSGFRFLGGGTSNITGTGGQQKLLDITRGQTIFYTGDTERARITSTGSVGINTSAPNARFQVNALSGTPLLYVDGTTYSYDASSGITLTASNTSAQTGINGIMLANNTYSVGAYSPILSFTSRSSSGSYNNVYSGIYGVLGGEGVDSNWVHGDLVFATSGGAGITERMRIKGGVGGGTTGNVGIGTAVPSTKLMVENSIATAYSSTNTLSVTPIAYLYNPNGGASVAATLRLDGGTGGGNGATTISAIRTGDGSSALTFGTRNAGADVAERVRITSTGNLGINTTTPAAKIDIGGNPTYENRLIWSRGNNDADFKAVLTSGDAGTTASVGGIGATYGGYKNFASIQFYRNSSNGQILFFTGGLSGDGTEKMRLNDTGSLLVGTSSAITGSKLTVAGQIATEPYFAINSSTATTVATGISFLAVFRCRGSGGTALVLYETNQTPVIISQVGTITFTTSTPTTNQIQIANLSGGGGITALCHSSVSPNNLNVSVIQNQ
jgi:hypothetical protein